MTAGDLFGQQRSRGGIERVPVEVHVFEADLFERARASGTSALEGDTCRRAAVGVLCSVVLIPYTIGRAKISLFVHFDVGWHARVSLPARPALRRAKRL